jgi:hypothetical protein
MKIIHFTCNYCGGPGTDRASEYARKKRHFCKRQCYTNYRREILPTEEQNAWKGGISPEESRRRWAKKNKAKVAAMTKARRLRELNAPGGHTPEQWHQVKIAYEYQCAEFDETCRGSITKDHKVPLIMGGSQNPDNLQPLCRSHNARKSRKVQLDLMSK